jgi:hypothetical protein
MTITTDAPTSAGQINGVAPPTAGAEGDAAPPSDQPPTEQPAGLSGRIILRNPGKPAVPLSEDLDLEELVAGIRPGGQITLHRKPGGPVGAVLLPLTDPRVKAYEIGVKAGQRSVVQASGSRRVADHYVEHLHAESVHFH